MMKRAAALPMFLAVCLGLPLLGCGTSGSRPVLFPEVLVQVAPDCSSQTQACQGRATFTAVLQAGGVQHTLTEAFTTTGPFTFFLENASPPYGGQFSLVPNTNSDNIKASLIITGQTSGQHGVTSGVDVPAVVGSFSAGLPAPALEVRFDVCIPSVTPGTCFGAGDSGVPGQTFGGQIGDSAETHLVGGPNATVPSIFFLENPIDTANGIFTLTPFTGQPLLAQLFINGVLKQSLSATQDVVIRQDL